MQINKLLKLKYSRKSKSASGFTLTELLISSFIGALVIGATGYALTNMLQGNKTATAQTNKRTEINRAMEFISDEIKRADTIDVDPATAFAAAAVPNPPSGAQPILALNIPNVTNAGVQSPIIYFVSDPVAGQSVWNGPKVIYRFGPPLNTNGEYNLDAGVAWALEPLVDGISDDSATVACDAGETASPSNGALGFYACIAPTTDNPAKGETAKIFAIGKHKLDNSNNSKYEYYQADTQVFARAEQEVLDGDDPDLQFDAACNFVSGALTCPGGGKKRYTVKTLANNFACKDADNKFWDVEFQVYEIDPITKERNTQRLVAIEEGVYESETQLVFEVKPDPASPDCQVQPFTPMSLYTSQNAPSPNLIGKPDPNSGQQNQSPVLSNDDNPSIRFKQLEDGDPIEGNLLKAGYGTQKRATENFEDPNNDGTDDGYNSDSLIDPADKTKINIEAGRYIIAFEMGQVDANQPGFDFQDQILSIQVANAP